MVILMFGPPGCGKGTQASFIAKRYGLPAISTGEIFRAELKNGTPLGRQASAIMAQGGLVGDDIVNQMVAARVSQPDCKGGFLLDGYPRTVAQAQFLDGVLLAQTLPEPTVIHLEVPANVLVRRVSSRRQCPACSRIYNLLSQPPREHGICDADGAALIRRQDDQEEVIHERLRAYEAQTGPVIEHYQSGKYYRLDGDREPSAVQIEIERLLAGRGRRARAQHAAAGVASMQVGVGA